MIKSDLEEHLEQGPERIQRAFLQWKDAALKRQMIEKQVYLRLKDEFPQANATELKYRLLGDPERQDAQRVEDIFEATLKAAEESHMSNKKLASLRTGFG